MNKRTKYLVAAIAVVIVVSNVMFSSRAKAPKSDTTQQLGPDFYASLPAELIQLRADLDRETEAYEQLIKPYHSRLEDLSEGRLSAEEAEALLAEVELKTAPQEMKVDDLRAQYKARLTEYRKDYLKRQQASRK